MSIQDGGSGSVSYSDHDVHHVRHSVETTAGDTSVNRVEDERQFEITERGLDPDELAELRAVRVQVGTVFNSSEGEDSVGSIKADVEAGFNLAGEEFLAIGNDVQESLDPNSDGTDEFVAKTKDTDEVGQFYTYSDSLSAPFDDDANGNGGGALATQQAEVINMSELFGSGPYVDAADDFTSLIQLREITNEARLGIQVQYSMYYNVSEVEGGRTRFGR